MNDTRVSLLEVQSVPVIRSPKKDGFTYTIDDVIGRGGSSIVYRAHYSSNGSNKYVLIKELYPYELSAKELITRKRNGALAINQSVSERWADYFSIAKNEQLSTNALRENKEKKTNNPYFFDQIETLEANGTLYSVLSTEEGETLLDLIRMSESSGIDCGLSCMSDVCQIILRILEALTPIHSHGMLHLDISPDNIYFSSISMNGNRLARLIDFNSVYDLNTLRDQKKCFSFKDGYSAFELSQAISTNMINVTYATDLFSVVAVFFRIIKGKTISNFSLHHFNSWKLDSSNKFCDELSDSAITLCNRILYKGLSFSQKNRYQSIDELKSEIIDLYKLCVKHPYSLRSNVDYSVIPTYFSGRAFELENIEKSIQRNGNVVLYGIGGTGKTTLALKYAFDNSDKYKRIIVLNVVDSLINSFADDHSFHIYGMERASKESLENYYKRKLGVLGDIVDDSTLIILDGVENINDPISDFLALSCSTIITTRNDFSSLGFPCVEVNSLDQKEAIELFKSLIPQSKQSEDYMYALLELVGYHTLTIELLARLIQSSSVSMQDLFSKLSIEHTSGLTDIKIVNRRNSKISFDSVTNHIQRLFEFSSLHNSKKITLFKLSVFDRISVQKSVIISFCQDNSNAENELNHLALLGWIKISPQNNTVSIHPIIADVLDVQRKKEGVFFDDFIQKCNLWLTPGFRISQEIQSMKLLLQENILRRYSFASKEYEFFFLSHTAELLREAGMVAEALEIFLQAMTLYDNNTDIIKNEAAGTLANNTGLLYLEDLNDAKNALDYFEAAEELLQDSITDESILSTLYGNISFCCSRLDMHSQAIEYANKAYLIAEHISDERIKISLMAAAQQKKGLAYERINDFDNAINELFSVCELIINKGNWTDYRMLFICEKTLSRVLRKKGDINLSLEAAEMALKITLDNELPDQDLISAHTALAEAYAASERYDDSASEYKKIEEMIKKKDYRNTSVGIFLCNYAAVCMKLENYEKAHALLTEAIDIFVSFGLTDNIENKKGFSDTMDWCINAMIVSYIVHDLDSAHKYVQLIKEKYDYLADNQKIYVDKYERLIE